MYAILSLHRLNASLLIKHVRNVNSQKILSKEDFGTACHTVSSESYFYDTNYKHLADNSVLKVDHKNKCLAFVKPELPVEEYFVNGPIPLEVKPIFLIKFVLVRLNSGHVLLHVAK